MHRTFRYPLYPTKVQETLLDNWLAKACSLYNAALEQRRDAWKKIRKSVSLFEQGRDLTELRSSFPDFAEVPQRVLRSSLRRVDLAFKGFFRRVKSGDKPGYPRFKSKNQFNSFSIGESCNFNASHVELFKKIGAVKFHYYREIKGELKNVIVLREGGKWFVLFQCDLGCAPLKITPKTLVGIDVGLTSLAVLSNGEIIKNPRYFKAEEKRLARRQQHVSRCKMGSKRRAKAKNLIGKSYGRLKDLRENNSRQIAQNLYKKWDAIALEDLDLNNLNQKNLAKYTTDAAWSRLRNALARKAESAGKHLVLVDPKFTSQTCSACGVVKKKKLSERAHKCPCGFSTSRDHNAAINIAKLGFTALVPGRGIASSEGENERSAKVTTVHSGGF